MSEEQSYEGDLQYVREVVERSEGRRAPASIFYLWAFLCLIGFPMADFAPRSVGLFWTIAAPAGFVVSALIGWRYSRTLGQVARQEGIYYALHWLGTLVAIFMVPLLLINDVLDPTGIQQVILLILALSYFTAGLYQVRPLLWVGILLGISYVVVALISGPVWTIMGVVLAGSLVATARIEDHREQD